MTAHRTLSEPERVDRDAGGERRVDPAGKPEQHSARTRSSRRSRAGPGTAPRTPPRRGRAAWRAGRRPRWIRGGREHERCAEVGDDGAPHPCRGTVAGVAQAGGVGGRGVDVADDQLLVELGAARHQLAVLVDHEAVAVEDELVLAADQVAEHDVGEASPARAGSASARAGRPCRGGRARPRCSRSPRRRRAPRRWPGGPGSQMSSQIVRPMVVPLTRTTAGVSPTWK